LLSDSVAPTAGSGKVCFDQCNGLCTACGTDYNMKVARNQKDREKLDITISFISNPIPVKSADCETCKSAQKRFAKRLARISSEATKRSAKFANAKKSNVPLKEAFQMCIEDRMTDGFDRTASCHICGTIKVAYQNEKRADMNKTAQSGLDEEKKELTGPATGTGNLKPNPMKDLGLGDGPSSSPVADDAEGDIPVSEVGESSEDSSMPEEMGGHEGMEDQVGGEGDGISEVTDPNKKVTMTVQIKGGCPQCDDTDMYDSESGSCGSCGLDGTTITITHDTETGETTVDTGEGSVEEGLDIGRTDTDSVLDELTNGEGGADSEDTSTDSEDPFSGAADDHSEETSEGGEIGESAGEESGTDTKPDFVKEGEDPQKSAPVGMGGAPAGVPAGGAPAGFGGGQGGKDLSSLAMHSGKLTKTSGGIGSNLDFDFLMKALNITPESLKREAGKIDATAPEKREAGNVKLVRTPNIMAAALKMEKTAQDVTRTQQTMPLSVEEDVDAGVPRDKSVGLNQTEPKSVNEVIKGKGGDHGSGSGGHTDVVPRDGSGDGLGGKKVSWEGEKADGQTSGNADTYVQTLQDREDPKKAGDKGNHATVATVKSMLKRFAAEKGLPENELEGGDFGAYYLVAHNSRVFKVAKEDWSGEPLRGDVVANFKRIQITVKANGEVEKVIKTASEETIKPNSPDGKKNHAITPTNKGVNTASADPSKAGQGVKPTPPDGKKNKAITPTNKGVNTAGNAGQTVKPNAPDGKKNHAITPTNKGVNTASCGKEGQPIKAKPISSPENKSGVGGAKKAGARTPQEAVAAVAKKLKLATTAGLEVGVFPDRFGVMELSSGKVFEVPRV
jgi:hypothetical protein